MVYYKSENKGVYFDIEEIAPQHLANILSGLQQRYMDMVRTFEEHIASKPNDESLVWRTALKNITDEGPAFLTSGLRNSEFATYENLIEEAKRRNAEEEKLAAMQAAQIEKAKRAQLVVPSSLTVERNPKA